MGEKGEPIKRIKALFNNISPHFDNWTRILQERVYGYVTWEHLKKYIPENKNSLILDAGGGTGRWAIPLEKIGYRVILCDISKGMLNQAEGKTQTMTDYDDKFFSDIRDIELHLSEEPSLLGMAEYLQIVGRK